MLDQSQLSGKAFRTTTSSEEANGLELLGAAGGTGRAAILFTSPTPAALAMAPPRANWFRHIGRGSIFSKIGDIALVASL